MKYLYAVILLLALGGCSKTVEIKPTALDNFKEQHQFSEQWQAFVGLGTAYYDLNFAPAIIENKIYILSKNGRLYTIDTTDGSRKDVIDLEMNIRSGITVILDKLLFSNDKGEVIAFDLQQNEIKWRTQLFGLVLHPPVSDGNIVVVKTNNDKLLALNLRTGNIQWESLTESGPLTYRGTSQPMILQDIVVSGHNNGKVLLTHVGNGQRLGEFVISDPIGKNEFTQINDVDGALTIAANKLIVGGVNGELMAIDLNTITRVWNRKFSTLHGVASNGKGQFFAVDEHSNIFGFNVADGSQLWSNEALAFRKIIQPVIVNDIVVVADGYGYVHGLNMETGEIIARNRLSPYRIQSTPTVVDGTAYILDIGGFLTALRVE